ncbi:MAG: hypothetical protein J3K34DRAFT_518502 [Monoraphidium minutum]|nr:MAG: hypothetical protein J3K34DRAFT_518502 [Monoraphidium minutum]
MQISVYSGARRLSQQAADSNVGNEDTLERLLSTVHDELAGDDCLVSVLDGSGGEWRDVPSGGGALQLTLAAAGVSPGSTAAVRFRLPPSPGAGAAPAAPPRRGQAGGAGAGARRRRWLRRAVAAAATLIKAVLILEAAGWALSAGGAALARRRRHGGGGGGSGSGSGSSSLAALDTDRMAEAVDALGSSDFEELGVEDGGAELRGVIEDMVAARQERRRQLEEEAAASGGGGDCGGGGGGRPRGTAAPREAGRGVTGLPVMKVGAWRRPRGDGAAAGAEAGGSAAAGGGGGEGH